MVQQRRRGDSGKAAFPGEAFGEKHLQQRLAGDVAAVGENFEVFDHGDGQAQRYRFQRWFEVNGLRAFRWPSRGIRLKRRWPRTSSRRLRF